MIFSVAQVDQELLGLDGDLGDEVAVVKVASWLFPIFAPFALGRTPLYVVTLHQLTATGKGEEKSDTAVRVSYSVSHAEILSPVVAFPLLPLPVSLLPLSPASHREVRRLVARTSWRCHRLILGLSLHAVPRTVGHK